VAEAYADSIEATDGVHHRQESGKEDQAKEVLRVPGEMEKSPSGRCQLGDRSSDTEAWTDHAGAHGQEPMKLFKSRSMMQEHPQHIKRASTLRENSWTTPARILKYFGNCCATL
jgi:hypothetical protein